MKFANYEFDLKKHLIGSGQSSQVYKARDMKLDRTVALKILEAHVTIDPEASERFRREARAGGKLINPNIAMVFDFDTTEVEGQKRSYIAMEFLEGKPLDKVIKENVQTLGYEECLRIAEQIASALAMVHESGIIHRDLKPGNVMVMDDGMVKLLDFGIARAADESSITQQGMLVGTVLYMSPEQVRGEELTFTSDVFAFGSVLYHLCTGKLPFPGSSFPEVCMTILDCEPEDPSQARPGFPEPISALIEKCLEPEPVDRFDNGREVHTAILAAIKEMHSSTSTLQIPEGNLHIMPFKGGDESGGLASGTRKDLAASLKRTKRITVHLSEDVDAAADLGVNFILSGELSTHSAGASLEIRLERWGIGEKGRAVVQEWEDVIQLDEEDDMILQVDLARDGVIFVRQCLSEVVVRPANELGQDSGESEKLAHEVHDELLRGTYMHVLRCIVRLRAALKGDAYSPRIYSCLSEAMVRQFLMTNGDPAYLDEAREYANQSLALDQECAEAHTSLGFAYQHSGEPTDAQREYRIAIQISHKSHKEDKGKPEWMAHSYLGALLAREGNFSHAQEHLEKSLEERPGHVGAADNLYLVHMRLGHTESAITVAEAGIENGLEQLLQYPDDQETRTHTALLFARLGRGKEARELIQEARKRKPKDAFTHFRIACILAVLGDSEDAVSELTAARDRGYFVRGELLGSMDLEILRGLPGFDDLLL